MPGATIISNSTYLKEHISSFQICFPPKLPIPSEGITILPVNSIKNPRVRSSLTIFPPHSLPPFLISLHPCPTPCDLSLASHPTIISKFRPSWAALTSSRITQQASSLQISILPSHVYQSIFLPMSDQCAFLTLLTLSLKCPSLPTSPISQGYMPRQTLLHTLY